MNFTKLDCTSHPITLVHCTRVHAVQITTLQFTLCFSTQQFTTLHKLKPILLCQLEYATNFYVEQGISTELFEDTLQDDACDYERP